MKKEKIVNFIMLDEETRRGLKSFYSDYVAVTMLVLIWIMNNYMLI